MLEKETYGGSAFEGDLEELEACGLESSPFKTGRELATSGLAFELKDASQIS
jgi:hypothetical protein